MIFFFFFFNDTATTEIYTLSLHDALPICPPTAAFRAWSATRPGLPASPTSTDRKSTRLNSSHLVISYAVFCLKKKKNNLITSNYDHELQNMLSNIVPGPRTDLTLHTCNNS